MSIIPQNFGVLKTVVEAQLASLGLRVTGFSISELETEGCYEVQIAGIVSPATNFKVEQRQANLSWWMAFIQNGMI